jgi:hypothetical protein
MGDHAPTTTRSTDTHARPLTLRERVERRRALRHARSVAERREVAAEHALEDELLKTIAQLEADPDDEEAREAAAALLGLERLDDDA